MLFWYKIGVFCEFWYKIRVFCDTKFSKVKFINYRWTNMVSRNTSEPEYFVLHFKGRLPPSLSTTTRASGWTPENTERVRTWRRNATSWYSRPSPLTVITNLQQTTSMWLVFITFFILLCVSLHFKVKFAL